MTENVYHSWLTERGIDSPGSQPFVLLGSEIAQNSKVLILAVAVNDDVASVIAVNRLAQALKTPKINASWVVADSQYSLPSVAVLRGLMPELEYLIMLSDNDVGSSVASFPVEDGMFASRSLRKIYGPIMSKMSADMELKKIFWNQLRSWLAKPYN